MKSGGAAGVVLGLAAVGLAMGTSTVSANEKVVDANQPKVQETGVEVKNLLLRMKLQQVTHQLTSMLLQVLFLTNRKQTWATKIRLLAKHL